MMSLLPLFSTLVWNVAEANDEVASQVLQTHYQQHQEAEAIAEKFAQQGADLYTVPQHWLPLLACFRIDEVELQLGWWGAGNKFEFLSAQRSSGANIPCANPQALQTALNLLLTKVLASGFTVSTIAPRQIAGRKLQIVINLLALQNATVNDVPDDTGAVYGVSMGHGQPIKVHDLDEIIERITNIHGQRPFIQVQPDEDYKRASISIKNDVPLVTGTAQLARHGHLETWGGSINLNLTKFESVFSASQFNSRSRLGGNESRTEQLSLKVPLNLGIVSLSQSRMESHSDSGISNELVGNLIYKRQEVENRLDFNSVWHRDSQSVFTLGGHALITEKDTSLDITSISSQSPKLAQVGIDIGWQKQLSATTSTFGQVSYVKGLKCCNADKDSSEVTGNIEAAHAQYEKWHGKASVLKYLAPFDYPISLLSTARWMYANHGLYPIKQYSLVGSDAVQGIRNSSALVDKGATFKSQLSIPISVDNMWLPNGLVLGHAYGEGRSYSTVEKVKMQGSFAELTWARKSMRLSIISYMPHSRHDVSKEGDSVMFSLQMNY